MLCIVFTMADILFMSRAAMIFNRWLPDNSELVLYNYHMYRSLRRGKSPLYSTCTSLETGTLTS